MNLPNSLTILRIFFIPVLVVILLTREPNIAFLGVTINFAEWGVLILLAAAATAQGAPATLVPAIEAAAGRWKPIAVCPPTLRGVAA